MLSLGVGACLQAAPKESHLVVVKRVFWYLVNGPNFCLWYANGTSFHPVEYLDSDWVRDKVERKSTFGSCQFLCRSLVCWSSKKQTCVSLSTTEDEYITAASCCA
jgi:hypothetical protein